MNNPNVYHQIFMRPSATAVEGYIARTTKGDDEFDELVAQLGLEFFDVVEDHQAAVACLAYHCADRGWNLPIHVRYMENGALTSPFRIIRLAVADVKYWFKAAACQTCQKSVDELEFMLVKYSLTDMIFCSLECTEAWYEQLPFQIKGVFENAPSS